MTPTDDARIRDLLDMAVADVEPTYGLDRIRSRTASRRRRTWAWGAGGAVLATAATIAAVVALGGPSERSGGEAGPAGQSAATDERLTTGVLYFVGSTGQGPRLFAERRSVATSDLALDQALDTVVEGRSDDGDYGTAWPAGASLEAAQLEAGVLAVDLGGPVVDRPAAMTGRQAELALQQLVLTAQSVTGQELPVTFLHEGRRTPTILGEPTVEPVPRRSLDDVLAPVQVGSPADGSTVTSPVTVEGEASAYEGNVQWELMQAGSVVKRGYATTRECCTLSPYSFTVTAPPGEYTLVVHDEDVSDTEGNPVSRDTKAITVQ
jgi:hypothetical protein